MAITRLDPDGNGINDTYGLSFDSQKYYTFLSEIFAAFGVIPFDFLEKDGEIIYGGIQPEALEALTVLRRWYEKGIVDPEFVTDQQGSGRSLERKFLTGRIGYLPHGGGYNNLNETNATAYIHSLRKNLPDASFAIGYFPVGPRGHYGQRIWGKGGNIFCVGINVLNEPQRLIRMLRMFNDLMTDEAFFLEAMFGQRGVHWDFIGPDFTFGEQRQLLPPFDKRGAAESEVINLGAGFFSPVPGPIGVNEKLMDHATRRYISSREIIGPGMGSTFGKNDILPSAPLYLQDLYEFQKAFYVKLIRGERPLEDFEIFVRQWLERGGQKLLSEAHRVYKTRLRVYEHVGFEEGR
jgi:putative aldouronate transport system substrate-binding protein